MRHKCPYTQITKVICGRDISISDVSSGDIILIMTKLLLFDLGNVVLTNDYPYHTPEQLKEFCKHFNVNLDNLETAFRAVFAEYSVGKITEDEFWTKYLYDSRAEEIDIPFAKDFWRKNQAEIENMLSLLGSLKKNHRIAALTTIPNEWLEFKRVKFQLNSYFEKIISSGEYGVKKPDPKIYEIAMEQLNVDPKEVLFIDDYEIVLPPAQKLGMQTILFRGQKDLELKLKNLNLL